MRDYRRWYSAGSNHCNEMRRSEVHGTISRRFIFLTKGQSVLLLGVFNDLFHQVSPGEQASHAHTHAHSLSPVKPEHKDSGAPTGQLADCVRELVRSGRWVGASLLAD